MVVADSTTPDVARQESLDVEERIERLVAGDPDAQEWLYRRFAPNLFRRIRARFGADRALDPEGLLHDLFVWCYRDDAHVLAQFVRRNGPSDRTEFRLEGYLFGLVSGLVANLRRGRRRRGGDPVALEVVPETPAADEERSAGRRDALRKLGDCLRERGVRIYLYFVLRYVEGLTPEEVAEVTGFPRPKVYKLKGALARSLDLCVELLGL